MVAIGYWTSKEVDLIFDELYKYKVNILQLLKQKP